MDIGEQHLLERSDETEAKTGWDVGEGAAGVAYAFLVLHLMTKDKRWLAAGRSTLDRAIEDFRNAERNAEAVSRNYLKGTAGLARVLLRYGNAVPVPEDRERYHATAKELFPFQWDGRTDAVEDVNPGLMWGWSGVGETMLQVAHWTGDGRYQKTAAEIAQRLLRFFGCQTDEGLALPGAYLMRFSTDVATGSAGVAMFLWNLIENRPICTTGFEPWVDAWFSETRQK